MMWLLVLLPLLSLVCGDNPQFSDNRGAFKENGLSFKHNDKKGKEKGEFGVAFLVEETEDGSPVCGGHSLIKLGDNVMMSRVQVETDDRVTSGPLNTDKLDPSGRVMRRQERGGMRRVTRRAPGGGPGRDSEQSIYVSENLTAESTSSSFKYNGQGGEPRFGGRITVDLITSEEDQNITVGSESQIIKEGNIKFTLEISNYTFCGGERVCQCENGTNSTATYLKVCFKTKGSRSGKPQKEDNEEDGLPEFDVGDSKFKFSQRFIRQNDTESEIIEIPDDEIETMVKTLDGNNIPVVCVTFERGSDGDTETITYDPTMELDDEDDDDDDSGCSAVVPYGILVLLMTMFNIYH